MRALRRVALKAAEKVRTDGLRGTVIWAAQNFMQRGRVAEQRRIQRADPEGREFDARYGVDTAGYLAIDEIAVSDEVLAHGRAYQGTVEREFKLACEKLPIDPREFTFFDIGCGKGRVLIFAADAGFRRMVGVEMSEPLCETARANWRALKARDPEYPSWEIVCTDAAACDIPAEPLVLFFNNPFDATIMSKFVSRLHAARRHPAFVIYINPVDADVWESSGIAHLISIDKYAAVYELRP